MITEPPHPPPNMLAERLEKLIEERGTTARALSLKAGLTSDAIRNIFRGQSSSPRGKTLTALADALGVSVPYLLGTDDAPAYHPSAVQPEAGMLEVGEYDVRSLDGQPATEDTWRRVHTWLLPMDLLQGRLTPGMGATIIRVPDESLAPDYRLGDYVIMDGGARIPSPPGVFLLSDGYSCSLARCELLRGQGVDRMVKVNQRGSEVAISIEEAGITGRILGRWCWS